MDISELINKFTSDPAAAKAAAEVLLVTEER